MAIANCQKMKYKALYCDVEKTFTPGFARKNGVNPEILDIIQSGHWRRIYICDKRILRR